MSDEIEYPVELKVEDAARDVLVPTFADPNSKFSGPAVYDLASQIAHRFTQIHTEWTKHGRALESDQWPVTHTTG